MNIFNRIAALVLSVLALNIVAKADGTTSLQTDADANGTYLISTAEELSIFVDMVNSGMNTISCRLMDDIEYSGGMIATKEPFEGTFDGNFFTLTVDVDANGESSHVGLFREANGATIQNLTLKGQIKSNCSEVSALVGSVNSQNLTVNRCLIDLQLVNTSDANVNKSFSGVVGEICKGATVAIEDVAFVGSFVEQNVTSGSVVCSGFIGMDMSEASSIVHYVTNSYVLPSFDVKSPKYVYYPVGNVYVYKTKFGKMQCSTTISNCYYLEDEDINTEIQNVSLFSDYTGLIAPYFADPDFVTILGDKAWEPGASYPVLTIPTVVFIGKGSVSLSSNWEGGNKPKSYTNVLIKGEADILNSLTCRVFKVASTGSAKLLGDESKLSAQSLVLDGKLTVSGNTTVVTKNIDAGSQNLILKYDASIFDAPSTPSLKYFGKFTGSAKIERIIRGQKYYYMGSATEEMVLNTLSASTYSWNLSSDNKWEPSAIAKSGHTLDGGITTPQLFGMDCPGVGTMTQIGTPAKSQPVVVATKSKGTNMFTNPYPYTVDLKDNGAYYAKVKNVVGNSVYSRVLESESGGAYAYKVATYDIKSGVATNSRYLYPFQDVSFDALVAGKQFELPNKMAKEAAAIKSAKIEDVRRDYFSIAVYSGSSAQPSDEVALLFNEEGMMVPEIEQLDSKVAQLYKGENNVQVISQLLLRKPESDVNLAIAVYPVINQMLDVEMPLTLIAKEGETSLTIEPLANFDAFEAQVNVYLKDNLNGAMVNLGKEPRYQVPNIDQLSDNRFAIVLKSKSATLTSISDAEMASGVNAYVANGKVIVDVPESFIGQNVDIYSTFGNKVLSLPAEKHNTIDVPKSGIYIVVVNGVKNKVSVK